jgi:hypothetical protein
MNKMNPAIKNSKAQLVRKSDSEQSTSKTNLHNYQPLIMFYHDVKSGSVELLNTQNIGGC